MKIYIKSLEEVPENLRTEYVPQKSGGYMLKVDDVNVDDLRTQAETFKQKAESAESTSATKLQELQDLLAKTRADQEKWQNQYYTATVQQKATEAFLKNGGNEKAIPVVLAKIKETFKYNSAGVLEALDAENKPILQKDQKPFTIESYIKDVLAVENDFLFKGNAGGGSHTPSQQTSMKNPFDKSAPNYTEQAKLFKSDPALAKSLAQQAGVQI